MKSEACYKAHTTFVLLPVKVEIKFLCSLPQLKKKFREQFISLVKISFYVIYFTKGASSITSRQKMFCVSKITLEKQSNGLNNLIQYNLSRG